MSIDYRDCLYIEADERRDARDECYYDDLRDEHEMRSSKVGGCRCFAPGEAPGTCPGPENCPLCDDGDEQAAE